VVAQAPNLHADYMRRYRQNRRDGCHRAQQRFDFAPFEREMVRQGRPLHRWFSSTTVWRYRSEGIPEFTADEYACKIGKHPSEIWGAEWWL